MNIRVHVHLLLLFSGAAALAHQVLWTRCLVDVLGASAGTFARVVGAFFVGLALGGALAALSPARPAHGWRRVVFAELGVAALALPVLFAVPIGEELRGAVPAPWLQVGLPFLLVLPPAVLMGLVLPAAAGSVGGRAAAVGLYAVNTLGGVLGILLIALLALPRLGTLGSGLLACGCNVVVAALAGVLARRDWISALPAGVPAEPTPETPLPGRRWLAFGSGFVVLGLEVALQHQFAQIAINSYFSSATVLTFVLVALVAAAALSGWVVRRFRSLAAAVQSLWAVTALLVAVQPLVFRLVRPGLVALDYNLLPGPYLLRVTVLAAVLLVPVFFAAGFVFPLLLRSLPTQPGAGPEVASRRATRRGPARELAVLLAVLLAVNGLGGWLGAEAMQELLLPTLGLWLALPALAGISLLGWLAAAGPAVLRTVGLAAVIVAAGWMGRRLPQVTLEARDRLADLRVGREGVVATVQRGPDDWRIVFNNSYTLGGSKAQVNQERQGLLPVLLHGQARSVALLGVATGSTTAGAALHPDVQRIEATELSELVIRFSREHFRPFNRDIFADPRVTVRHQDARWVMAEQPGAFDVVIGDLFLPWRTGEGRLFAAEHFATVHRALRPDGLFCQWLPLFQLTRAQFETIVRTFSREFPDAFLVRGDFYTELPIVGLVGGRPLGSLDWNLIQAACDRVRRTDRSRDPLVRHADGVAMTLIGPAPRVGEGPVNTLGNGWLEWDAGRNIVGLRTPWFIGVPCAELIRRQHQEGLALVPSARREAHDAGQFFLTLSVADKVKAPVLANLQSQITERLPESLRTDPGADWKHWPMRLKPFAATHTAP
jgi:spermidine synthase